jgi:hypothetical protein
MVQIVLDLCFLHSNADKISEASQACLEPKATITPQSKHSLILPFG